MVAKTSPMGIRILLGHIFIISVVYSNAGTGNLAHVNCFMDFNDTIKPIKGSGEKLIFIKNKINQLLSKDDFFLQEKHLVIFRHFLRLIGFHNPPVGQFEDGVFNCRFMLPSIFDDFVQLNTDQALGQDSAGYNHRHKTFTSWDNIMKIGYSSVN